MEAISYTVSLIVSDSVANFHHFYPHPAMDLNHVS
jgi:hypothetical protein